MKAKIKATGEIINIASYAKITLDKCNSYGTPIEMRPEEVELIANIEEDDYWQNMKVHAAIAALQGIVSSHVTIEKIVYLLKVRGDDTAVGLEKTVAERAVTFADELIKQLKEK